MKYQNVTEHISIKIIVIFLLSISCLSLDAQLFINEVMAKNDNVITDDRGQYEDWIEIYNAGSNAVNLANYKISDGNTDWVIADTASTTTTVEPKGFLLLWADEDPKQGADHIDFKLSANGETITIFDPSGSMVDEVTFGLQNSDISYGRSVDGGSTFQIFATPTPNASNNNNSGTTFPASLVFSLLQGSDDAEEPVGVNFTDIDDTHIQIVNDWSGDQTVGFRFANLGIPKGTLIDSAFIQFTSAGENLSIGASNITIQAHNIGNSPTFSTSDKDISSRAVTSTSVNWAPDEWPSGSVQSEDQRTPNLKNVVEEIVNRPDWSQGNALSFIMTGSGVRAVHSFETDNGKPAKLTLHVRLPASDIPLDQLVINEIAPTGTDFFDDEGDAEDWIELYNAGNSPLVLGGLYLTDDLDNLTKWQIQTTDAIAAKGFAIIWADDDTFQEGLHANFNLEGSGETIALVQIKNNEVLILDSLTYPRVPIKASYGRKSDGASEWVTFGEISPNASNNNALEYLSAPALSLANGIYQNAQNLEMNHSESGVVIRYTLDGSEPNSNSILYSGPILIDSDSSVRSKAFKANRSESPSSAGSYLFQSSNLNTLFINTDPDHFFSDETGIYVEGTNGIKGFCTEEPVNWNQDWERPIHLTMFDIEGTEVFSVNAGVKIGGGCSRAKDQKSLNVYLRKKLYGYSEIDYPLFGEDGGNSFEILKLRNSGQDYVGTMMRDGVIQSSLRGKVDIDLQGYLPSVLYINGQYWGIHNIRETYSDEYFKEHYGVDKEDLILIKNPGLYYEEVEDGNVDDFRSLYHFIENNDLSIADHYEYVEDEIDMDEFINYWAFSVYVAKHDWPANNIIIWKEDKNKSKWRWAAIDHDGSSGSQLSPRTNAEYNTLMDVTDPISESWPNHKNSTLFFRKLLENESFRNEYIQRTCSFSSLIYGEEVMENLIDSISGLIRPEMPNQIEKWGKDCCNSDLGRWEIRVDQFKQFFVDRPDFMKDHMKSMFALDGTYRLTLNFNQSTDGFVVVNSNRMKTPYQYSNDYFKNIPVRITAVANPGFIFSHWVETGETNPEIDFVSDVDATLTPVFITTSILGEDLFICPNTSVNLSAKITGCNECKYEWSNGKSKSNITVSPSERTSYSVTVTNDSGTTAEDMVVVSVWPEIEVSFSITQPDAGSNNGAVNLSISGGVAPFTVLWSDGVQSEDRVGLSTDVYSATVTDINGCSIVQTFNLSTVSNFTIDDLTKFDIYPNPNSGIFTADLTFESFTEMEIEVLNIVGQSVFKSQTKGLNIRESIDLSQFRNGIYLFVVKTPKGRAIQKVFVEGLR